MDENMTLENPTNYERDIIGIDSFFIHPRMQPMFENLIDTPEGYMQGLIRILEAQADNFLDAYNTNICLRALRHRLEKSANLTTIDSWNGYYKSHPDLPPNNRN